MNRIEELTLRLIDDDLISAEITELEQRTAESQIDRQTFVRILQLESQLLSSGRKSQAEEVVRRIEAGRAARIEERVIEKIQASEDRDRATIDRSNVVDGATSPPLPSTVQSAQGDSWPRPLPCVRDSWPRPLRVAVTIAACLLLAVTIHFATRSDQPAMIATFTTDSTTSSLTNNQTVRTSGSLDTAEITYDDGTIITLLGNTTLTVSSYNDTGKQIVVDSGLIQADVAKQPAGLPVRIVTPTATMEVLGTTLGVEVSPEATQLEVSSGLVAMTRNSDGQRVEVGHGKFARATSSDSEQLHAAELPTLPETWSLDFASGLPGGWQTGTLIEDELAVKVERIRSKDTPYALSTHNAWQEGDHGLFAIRPDSVLHIEFRQREFSRIRVMVAARVFPAERGRFGANCFYTRKAWNEDADPGQWTTLSIPLARVDWYSQRRKQQPGTPDLSNMAAYLIQVATEDNIDLTINRMWVTSQTAVDRATVVDRALVVDEATSPSASVTAQSAAEPTWGTHGFVHYSQADVALVSAFVVDEATSPPASVTAQPAAEPARGTHGFVHYDQADVALVSAFVVDEATSPPASASAQSVADPARGTHGFVHYDQTDEVAKITSLSQSKP